MQLVWNVGERAEWQAISEQLKLAVDMVEALSADSHEPLVIMSLGWHAQRGHEFILIDTICVFEDSPSFLPVVFDHLESGLLSMACSVDREV